MWLSVIFSAVFLATKQRIIATTIKIRLKKENGVEPEGLLAGVLGLKLLGFALIEGFANEFPVKLLRMGLPISEFLTLGFGLLAIGEDDDLFGGMGMAMMSLLCYLVKK